MSHAEPADSSHGWLHRWVKRAWWFHSFFALAFGIGVMVYARKGLEFADKILLVLGLSWILMFVALRFIVGPSNRAPEEKLTKKGVRLVTNYVIKNLYQQMFFFLVPLYASSATWSLASYNWWLPPLLLIFAVLSTMDLIFDNVVMEHKIIASLMYGLALFGVLNLILPLVFGMKHFPSLLIAATATAPAVALLNFRIKEAVSAPGLAVIAAATSILFGAAWFGRALVPPAPLALVEGSVGHGSVSSYECLPPAKSAMRVDRLDGLRCGSVVTEPGGLKDDIVHVWRHRGETLIVMDPVMLPDCHAIVALSEFPPASMPADPLGEWECRIETADRQLVGLRRFEVIAAPSSPGSSAPPPPGDDAGPAPVLDAGTPSPSPSDAQRGE